MGHSWLLIRLNIVAAGNMRAISFLLALISVFDLKKINWGQLSGVFGNWQGCLSSTQELKSTKQIRPPPHNE